MPTPAQLPGEAPPPKLLERLRIHLRTRHYSIRTEQAYVDWARRFILFHGKRHPQDMGVLEMETFLSHLAVEWLVSASTQNQAKAAILYLYKQVLGVELPCGGAHAHRGTRAAAARAGHGGAGGTVALRHRHAVNGGAAAAREGCGVRPARDCRARGQGQQGPGNSASAAREPDRPLAGAAAEGAGAARGGRGSRAGPGISAACAGGQVP